MDSITNHISIIVIFITAMILSWLLATSANALLEPPGGNPITDDIVELCLTGSVRQYFRANGLLKPSISDESFSRYFTMVEQNCKGDSHVYPALVLAVIAVESNFDTNAYSDAGARGLMQLMPLYHTSSLSEAKGSPASKDDFFVPEWNVATGVRYLGDLIEQGCGIQGVEDPVGFALMCYNQGPTSASKSYFSNEKHLSGYAKRVIDIAEDLQDILSKGDLYRAQT